MSRDQKQGGGTGEVVVAVRGRWGENEGRQRQQEVMGSRGRWTHWTKMELRAGLR